ncbi:MAG: hypothetical protein R2867_44410 [Caldilineaceae bacterium]
MPKLPPAQHPICRLGSRAGHPRVTAEPTGVAATDFTFVTLGGQAYVRFTLPQEPDKQQLREMAMLAMTSAFFIQHDQIGEVVGPLLQPLESDWQAVISPDLVATRRYRGKTNELFTHFLCNVARASSAFAHEPWQNLTVMDPLMGGGTTLFVALMLGAQKVGGVDSDTDDVRSTATFLQQYLQNERISHKMQPERLKGLGLRWQCTIGKKGATDRSRMHSGQRRRGKRRHCSPASNPICWLPTCLMVCSTRDNSIRYYWKQCRNGWPCYGAGCGGAGVGRHALSDPR